MLVSNQAIETFLSENNSIIFFKVIPSLPLLSKECILQPIALLLKLIDHVFLLCQLITGKHGVNLCI